MKHSILIIAGAMVFSPATFAQDGADHLTLEHYLDWSEAADVQISPDGETVVYTRRRVDPMQDEWDSQLWVMRADGSRHRFLAEGSGPRWAPDGTRIAYLANEGDRSQIHVRWMDAPEATSQITHARMPIKAIEWSPDGRRIAFLAEVELEPAITIELPARPEGAQWVEDAFVTDRLNYRIDRQGRKNGFDHLFVVSADGGAPRQITEGEWDVGARFSGTGQGVFTWSPDGEWLIFDGHIGDDVGAASRRSDIHRVRVADRRIETLTGGDGFWTSPAISPEGSMIAYTGWESAPDNYPAVNLMVMNFDGSNARPLATSLPDAPSNLTWSGNGRTLYYGMNFQGSTELRSIGLTGQERSLTSGMHRFSFNSMSDNGRAAGVYSAPHITANASVADIRRGNITQLTDLNRDLLDGVRLGEVEEIWYESSDDTRVQGWIVYPPDFDPAKDYPLHLVIHGGPHAMYGVNFSYPFQEWAANGYVVLFTNPRGSTGYSPSFANAIDNAYPGQADYDDLMAGVDTVLARGFIDEDRLFVSGCSGGGVLTAWIVTQTDRFAAAASLCPVTNWISFTGQADISAWAFERFRPHYWEDPDLWLAHSPIMHAHRVQTPTLLMTGVQDLRTPIAQAEEFYANLRRRGVPTALIAVNNEYHGTTRTPSNMLRTQLYLRSWFEEHGPGGDGAEDTE